MAWTLEQMEEQSRQAVCELLEVSGMTSGQILVVGCSSSEVVGGHIGKASSLETAQAIFRGSEEFGLWCRREASFWPLSAAST